MRAFVLLALIAASSALQSQSLTTRYENWQKSRGYKAIDQDKKKSPSVSFVQTSSHVHKAEPEEGTVSVSRETLEALFKELGRPMEDFPVTVESEEEKEEVVEEEEREEAEIEAVAEEKEESEEELKKEKADPTFKYAPDRPGTGGQDSDMLQLALTAIQKDLVAKGEEILKERDWIVKVEQMMEEYTNKIGNVKHNINQMEEEMKGMLKKKRQIQNAILQVKLNDKLEDAKSDMNMIESALETVQKKYEKFAENKDSISNTVDALQAQLDKLKNAPTVDPEELESEEEKMSLIAREARREVQSAYVH